MIRMPKRVLKRWREIASDPSRGSGTIIELLFSSKLDPDAAADVLTASLRRVQDEYDRTHQEIDPVLGAPPSPGEWDVTPVPDGALLWGGHKADDGEALLLGIVADLDARGISGTLDLYALPEAPRPRVPAGVLDASLRTVDRDAFERVGEAATRWCLRARPDRALTLDSGRLPTMLLRRVDVPFERVRSVLDREYLTELTSIGEDRFRTVALRPDQGRVSLITGGPHLHRAGWRPLVEELREFLVSVSSELVYARIRREPELHQARDGHHGERLRAYGLLPIAREDHLAPDAFAIQLLGPGYAGRRPASDVWRVTELPGDRALLEHTDPAAWLDEITLADAILGGTVPPAAVLGQARESLAGILHPVDVSPPPR